MRLRKGRFSLEGLGPGPGVGAGDSADIRLGAGVLAGEVAGDALRRLHDLRIRRALCGEEDHCLFTASLGADLCLACAHFGSLESPRGAVVGLLNPVGRYTCARGEVRVWSTRRHLGRRDGHLGTRILPAGDKRDGADAGPALAIAGDLVLEIHETLDDTFLEPGVRRKAQEGAVGFADVPLEGLASCAVQLDRGSTTLDAHEEAV